MITNKKHEEIVRQLKYDIKFYQTLSVILNKLVDRSNELTVASNNFLHKDDAESLVRKNLPKEVAVYVDDIITGGKVIKQEATKAIVISPEGDVKQGWTKLEPQEDFSYCLVRE